MIKAVIKNWPKAFLPCFLGVILSLSFYGCGGTFRSFPGEGDISGDWNLFLTQSQATSGGAKLVTLTQTEDNITGTTSTGETLTGTISSHDITLTLNNTDGSTTTLTGTVGADWKTMSGNYTSTGADGSGTWTATKVPPVPAPLAVTPSSITLSCSAQASQGFSITGGTPSKYSVTISTNGSLITLSTTTPTNGQFTVTANACSVATTTVDLTVTDGTSSVPITVTVSNP